MVKKKPTKPGRAGRPVNIPVDFDKAVDGIVNVPKSEVDKEEKRDKRKSDDSTKP